MNFEKAIKELLAGKKIRRKEWSRLLHLRMIEGTVIAFDGESNYMKEDPDIFISSGWTVVDGDGTSLTFLEGIEQLKNKKCLTREGMGESFIFVDDGQIVICKPVVCDFMPTWNCINASDWEVIK